MEAFDQPVSLYSSVRFLIFAVCRQFGNLIAFMLVMKKILFAPTPAWIRVAFGAVLSLLLVSGMSHPAQIFAQSNISGDISGTVTDPSGAAVSNAQVTVTNKATGQVKTAVTGASGDYRVPLLSPGAYKILINATGFEGTSSDAVVSAGTIVNGDAKLTVGQASSTVEVTGGEYQLLHTEDAQVSTTFDMLAIQSLPNPGNDLTFVAQTTPGATMNTQGGYGNFSVFGLPATSNTFTLDGGYEGDPYLNVNNSGATNLLLGNNDVDTVTVTTNAYDAAFGGLGGAQVNEISRCGRQQLSRQCNLLVEWPGDERQ